MPIAQAEYACYIFYNYDNSGNRIDRHYQCGNTGGSVMKQVPGTGQVVQGMDSNLLNTNTCSLRPNPSNGHFSAILQYPVKDAEIYIMDMRGVVIARRKLNGTRENFDISDYASGVYVMHLKSGNDEFETKVVKE
jgi:hypothetical protein